MVVPSDVTTRTSVGDGRSASKSSLNAISRNKSFPETELCSYILAAIDSSTSFKDPPSEKGRRSTAIQTRIGGSGSAS